MRENKIERKRGRAREKKRKRVRDKKRNTPNRKYISTSRKAALAAKCLLSLSDHSIIHLWLQTAHFVSSSYTHFLFQHIESSSDHRETDQVARLVGACCGVDGTKTHLDRLVDGIRARALQLCPR